MALQFLSEAGGWQYALQAIRQLVESKAPLLSPVFWGTPRVPTASPGTNTTQAASTAFVTAAVTASGAVASDSAQNILANQVFGA